MVWNTDFGLRSTILDFPIWIPEWPWAIYWCISRNLEWTRVSWEYGTTVEELLTLTGSLGGIWNLLNLYKRAHSTMGGVFFRLVGQCFVREHSWSILVPRLPQTARSYPREHWPENAATKNKSVMGVGKLENRTLWALGRETEQEMWWQWHRRERAEIDMLLLASRVREMMSNSLDLMQRQIQPLNLSPGWGTSLALGNDRGPRWRKFHFLD